MKTPTYLYRHNGKSVDAKIFDASETDTFNQAVTDGWTDCPRKAKDEKGKENRKEQEKLRAGLEKQAKELGIKFGPKTLTRTLITKIKEKLADENE